MTQRLNYIGSKYKLLDWITESLQHVTGWQSFQEKRIADIFAGTGIVSYHFRTLGATVHSNDAELYSSVITHALTVSVYTDRCKQCIETWSGQQVGFVTRNYSPYEDQERMFFTVENAQRIDYVRSRIEEERQHLTHDETMFLLASLLISADMVSNVPAVYGCYLKQFKDKALKPFVWTPIHTLTTPATVDSRTWNTDITDTTSGLYQEEFDAVYLDPPYNERQYSKNYFPLNVIAKRPDEQITLTLTGKTGIPTDSFVSPFCSKRKVGTALKTVLENLQTDWIVLSYSNEGLLSKQDLLDLCRSIGEVTLIEKAYKRFKSFAYNESGETIEYLICIKTRRHERNP